jgi:hypothetical protein
MDTRINQGWWWEKMGERSSYKVMEVARTTTTTTATATDDF